MANQANNNKNQQSNKSVAESVKNADWAAFQTVHTNSETTDNATTNNLDANLTNDTNRANQ
jgi:hypothetical protein